MRCRFIQAESANHTVSILCRVMKVAKSSYYAQLRRALTETQRLNDQLLKEIRAIHTQSRQRYGARRTWREIIKSRPEIGLRRVTRLMKENGLRAKQVRRFRATTDSRHSHPIEPNLLNRNFSVDERNRVWTGDITYIWTRSGWLYLAVMLDLYSRRVVGWSMSSRIDQKLALNALHMAVGLRQPEPGWLHHTDRGSQYTSNAYRKALGDYQAVSSMSRKGDCWDNAVTESFFGTLKKEAIFGEDFKTRDEAKSTVLEYLRWYNADRMHSSIEYLSPNEYELENAELTLSQAA